MCNQQYLRLLAGEPVPETEIVYRDRHSGRTYVLNVLVEKDHHYLTYLEASMMGVTPVRIPHCYIFAQQCPLGLDVKQQNVWKVLRYCLRKEISFYKEQCEAKREASRQELARALSSLTPRVSPLKCEMVVLPKVSAISTVLSSPSVQFPAAPEVKTRLVPGIPMLTSVRSLEKALVHSIPKPRGMILMPEHLSLVNLGVGRFKLPSLEGPLSFTRCLSEGQDLLQLRLENVPARHCLYPVFKEEELRGHKISVWIGQQGPMPTLVGSAAWRLQIYLKDEAWREPSKVAA